MQVLYPLGHYTWKFCKSECYFPNYLFVLPFFSHPLFTLFAFSFPAPISFSIRFEILFFFFDEEIWDSLLLEWDRFNIAKYNCFLTLWPEQILFSVLSYSNTSPFTKITFQSLFASFLFLLFIMAIKSLLNSYYYIFFFVYSHT